MTDEKKARLKQIREKLKSLSDQEKKQLLDNGLIATIDGKILSTHNTMMCYLQTPGIFSGNATLPTVVGGFKQWKNAGRYIVKGQHGMTIFFPVGPKVETENGEKLVEAEHFYTASVFDITQTENMEVKS
jgi:hypothetical protein